MIGIIRRLIYCLALLWALFLYGYVAYTIPDQAAALSSLMRYYGLTALALVFLTLTPGLIRTYAPKLRIMPVLIRARRALGVSTFYFALTHATIGFFLNLGGKINAIFYLAFANQLAIIFSSTALIIFSLLALTSFDYMVNYLGSRWKTLHRFVYIAAILVLFHAFLIGSHFAVQGAWLPNFVNFFALIFIFLEAGAVMKHLVDSERSRPKWQQTFYAIVIGIVLFAAYLASNYAYTGKLGHASHTAPPIPIEER
jgi:sulfoxide reductase heme-binding subunit YedZ